MSTAESIMEDFIHAVSIVHVAGEIGLSPRKKKGSHDVWLFVCQECKADAWMNEKRAFYHCFACGEKGNAVSLYARAKGVEYRDAIEKVYAMLRGLSCPN